MFANYLFRLLDDLYQAPPFRFAQRTALHDLHDVSDRALVLLVMGVEAGGFLYELAVDGVFHFPLHGNRDGLVHFVAFNHPDPRFTQISFNHCISFYAFFILPPAS